MQTYRITWAIVAYVAIGLSPLASADAQQPVRSSSPVQVLSQDSFGPSLPIPLPAVDQPDQGGVASPTQLPPPGGETVDAHRASPPKSSLTAPPWGQNQGRDTSATTPWWNRDVFRPMQVGSSAQPITVDDLIINALRFAPQIQAISDDALILATSIGESDAAFDIHSFMESKFIRTSEPIGSILTTGRLGRFRDSNWSHVAGLRRRTTTGGSLELSQRIGYQDNNSSFFVPTQQGNARLSLSYNQPLLNGAGRAYNLSLVVLAQIDANIVWDQTLAQLQNQVFQITDSYWQLYLDRAVLLQRHRHLKRAESIYLELEARREVDALVSQIVRAKSAVEIRRAELVRAMTSIRNTETRIRTLVNAPQWQNETNVELIPTEAPTLGFLRISVHDAVATSLQNRPEVDEAMKEIDAARVRLDMSYNELRPALSLVLETYVSGLEGGSEVGQALANQFNQGEPSYTAGLVFERPWQNRAARERYLRRKLEMRQLTNRFAVTLNELKQEAEIAVREVNASYGEVQGRHTAMMSAASEVEFLHDRWQLLPGDDRAASFALVNLLDAQDRLAIEEFRLAQAQRAYTMSLTELQRATGTLLQFEQITPRQTLEDGVPRTVFEKPVYSPRNH